MSKLRVLHIVPWFPNPNNKVEGVFIAEHIKALNKFCDNKVLHYLFGNHRLIEEDNFEGIDIDRVTLKPILNKWIFKEKLVSKHIIKYLIREQSNFDLVNFYITYPNAILITDLSKQFPKLKFCMMEQWSAYHTQFGLAKENKGRKRIENIFKNNIPLFTVSKALGDDILSFIGDKERTF